MGHSLAVDMIASAQRWPSPNRCGQQPHGNDCGVSSSSSYWSCSGGCVRWDLPIKQLTTPQWKGFVELCVSECSTITWEALQTKLLDTRSTQHVSREKKTFFCQKGSIKISLKAIKAVRTCGSEKISFLSRVSCTSFVFNRFFHLKNSFSPGFSAEPLKAQHKVYVKCVGCVQCSG